MFIFRSLSLFWLVPIYVVLFIYLFYAFLMFKAPPFIRFYQLSDDYRIRHDKPALFRFVGMLWGLIFLITIPSAGVAIFGMAPVWLILFVVMRHTANNIWRRQGYSRVVFWGATFLFVALSIAVSYYVRGFIIIHVF